jgi:hypothetical protein
VNWILLLLVLAWSAVPITLLVVDRVFDVVSQLVIRRLGWLFVVASVVLLAVVAAVDSSYIELVAWGALVGLIGTVTLDIVRLIGLRFGAFPLDMPIVFGAMATGTIHRFQHLVMGQVLHNELAQGRLDSFVADRVATVPSLSERQRINVGATMMGAIATLEKPEAEEVGKSQFAVLGSLDTTDRQAVMAAMDAAPTAAHVGQPRGLPRIPMAKFQPAAEQAVDLYRSESLEGFRATFLSGYLWHAVNGISFGIMYALIFGQGSWGWAIAWGVAVWLAMMLSMPLMMPSVKLPAWFPIVPLIAHVAMVIPFMAVEFLISDEADAASLLGWILR